MDDLVKKLVTELNISEEQANKAIAITTTYFKENSNDHSFKEKFEEWAGGAKEKIEDLAEDLAEGASEVFDKVKGFFSKMTDKKEEKKPGTDPSTEEKK